MTSSALDQVKWSQTDYEMKYFVESFADSLPILCQTTTGYAGCDDDIHQVAADDVYWIYAIQKQTRIVAKDKNKRYISIPVDNCKHRFQVVEDNNKKCSVVTSSDLLTSLRQNPSAPVRFQFEQDRRVSYQFGADMGDAARFGIMELQESYDEKYLLGFCLHSGHVYARTVGIPVYIDVSFTQAIGFEAEVDKGEKFRKWLEELRKVVDSLEKTSVNTCKAIIVFSERPSNGDYEYIRPTDFLRDTSKKPDKTHTDSFTGKVENQYSYIVAPERGLFEPTTVENPSDGQSSRTDEIIRVPIPKMPRRPPPKPSCLAEDMPQVEKAPRVDPTDNDETPPPIPLRKLPRSGLSAGEGSSLCKDEYRDVGPRLSSLCEDEYHDVGPRLSSPCEDKYHDGGPRVCPVNHRYSYEECSPGKDPKEGYTLLAEILSDQASQVDSSERPTHDPSDVESCQDDLSLHGNRVSSTPGLSSDQPPPIPPLPKKYTTPVGKTTTPTQGLTDTCSRLARYVTAAQVPSDENAKNWTIDDVIEALRLLKMSGYGNLFREREIDGALICSLDEKTLVEDFGFKLFEATKFCMFVQKGWRPK